MASGSSRRSVALVLSGGMGLGAYQAGAYEVLQARSDFDINRLVGSSVGAINAALIAGNAPENRMESLRSFWHAGAFWSVTSQTYSAWTPFGHLQSWISALHGRLLGAPGHFRPRVPSNLLGQFRSLYDLTPMRQRLERLVDFDLLNSGELGVTVAATDIETGETVLFDTARGKRVGIEHLLATCGYLPEFAPVEIDGRLLGDGGLSANAPIEALFGSDVAAPSSITVVLDLFSPDGPRPQSMEDALARKNDLIFSTQTLGRLRAYLGKQPTRSIVYLSYRAPSEEAGSEKTFDFSAASIDRRWQSGSLDMIEAIRVIGSRSFAPGLHIIRRA